MESSSGQHGFDHRYQLLGSHRICTQVELIEDVPCPELKPVPNELHLHIQAETETGKVQPNPYKLEGVPQQQHTPTVYIITTTYKRDTQKTDLVVLCQTLMHVQSLVWILVENSAHQTPMIKALLERCSVRSIHLTVPFPDYVKTSSKYSPKIPSIQHRNAGLRWLREHCEHGECNGVVYFGDDDDKYDLRFFDEIRKTEKISVFMVGLTGGLLMEGPYCEDGRVAKWHHVWGYSRQVPIDMQGFAINVRLVVEHKQIWMEGGGVYNDMAYIEASKFISQFLSHTTLECRTYKNEVLVWRSRTNQPVIRNERYDKTDRTIEF